MKSGVFTPSFNLGLVLPTPRECPGALCSPAAILSLLCAIQSSPGTSEELTGVPWGHHTPQPRLSSGASVASLASNLDFSGSRMALTRKVPGKGISSASPQSHPSLVCHTEMNTQQDGKVEISMDLI